MRISTNIAAKHLLLCMFLAIAGIQVSAQKADECQNPNVSLQKTDTCIRINTADALTQGLRQPNVISGDRVYIQLVRRPNEKCSVQLKTEVIPPPPSAFAIFLKTVKIAAAAPEGDVCQALADSDPTKPKTKTSDVETFEMDGKVLTLILVNLVAQIKSENDTYADTTKKLLEFQRCPEAKSPGAKTFCNDEDKFNVERQTLVASLDSLLSAPIPTSSLVDFQMKKLQEDLTAIGKSSPDWFANKAKQLACYDAESNGIKAHLKDVTDSRQQFAKIVEVIRGLDWPTAKLQLIPPQKNAKVTATVSCTNIVSGDPSMDPVSVIVSYTDVPKVTSTVGILMTLTPKQVIGTTAVSTGIVNGLPTYKNIFAVTSSAPVQIIPFTFLNVRLHYWRFREYIYTINAAGGIGVNPNSGTNQVEYFAGTSFGIGNLSIDFGAHFGEFQNLGGGFYLGQTVPTGLTKVPITTKYTIHPSFGFTYKLPLP